MKKLILTLSLFLLSQSFAENAHVSLQFQENIMTHHIIDVSTEIETAFPGFDLKETLKQKIFADFMVVPSDSSDVYELEMTLRRVIVSLRANDNSIKFDTDGEARTLPEEQLKDCVGKKVRFSIAKDLKFVIAPELENLQSLYPSLSGSFTKESLKSMVFYLFALNGRALSKGEKYDLDLYDEEMPISFNINAAGLREIQASISGYKESKELMLTKNAKIIFETVASGKGVWQTENALLYQVKIQLSTSGDIVMGEERVPLKVKSSQKFSSMPG